MKKHILIVILQLAAAGNDAYWTNHNMQFINHYEHNPIASPFVKTTPGCVGYFSVTAAAHIAAPWALRKYSHNKLATIVEWEGIADNGISGTYSATHGK